MWLLVGNGLFYFVMLIVIGCFVCKLLFVMFVLVWCDVCVVFGGWLLYDDLSVYNVV